MDENKSKVITIVLIVIIVAIVGVLGYLGFTTFSEKKTKNTYTNKANEYEKIVKSKTKTGGGNISINEINVNTTNATDEMMEGYKIIGTITIPKVDLKCPILENATKRAIEIAVGQMYTTSGLNEPGTTVIYGHNYRNELFFSRNDELQEGDEVIVFDSKGKTVHYKIYKKFETTMTDTSFYSRDANATEGKAELVLSTCTDDASETDRRLILQCVEK